MFKQITHRNIDTHTSLITVILFSLLLIGTLTGCNDTATSLDMHKMLLQCSDIDRSQPAQRLKSFGSIDSVLSGVYRVKADTRASIHGGITIAEGTIFILEKDAEMFFSDLSYTLPNGGFIKALGTAQKPILFCGGMPQKGYWKRVIFKVATSNKSLLSYVQIDGGGGGQKPMMLVFVGPMGLKNVRLTNSADIGLEANAIGKESTNLTITGSEKYPLHLTSANAINNLPDGKYTGNKEDIIYVEDFSQNNLTFHNRGIPYLQLNERTVFGRAGGTPLTITFEAGVELRFSDKSSMQIGWRSDPATIKILGTAKEPVIFTSYRAGNNPKPGDWKGLYLLTGTSANSVIEHAIFRYGGYDDPMLILEGGPTLVNHVKVIDSYSVGILAESFGKGSTDLTVKGSKLYPLQLKGPLAINNLPNGHYTGNGEDVIHVNDFSNTSVTFHDRGIPYLQTDKRIVMGSANGVPHRILFEEGVEYRFSKDATMQIGWRSDPGAIMVEGTKNNPVIFTSYRADKNPEPGDWGGIWLLTGSTGSSIVWAEISYGGVASPTAPFQFTGPYGNIVIRGGITLTILHTKLSYSGGAGIMLWSVVKMNINSKSCKRIKSGAAYKNTFNGNSQAPIEILWHGGPCK